MERVLHRIRGRAESPQRVAAMVAQAMVAERASLALSLAAAAAAVAVVRLAGRELMDN